MPRRCCRESAVSCWYLQRQHRRQRVVCVRKLPRRCVRAIAAFLTVVAGIYCPAGSTSTSVSCPAGEYCPAGSAPVLCPAGMLLLHLIGLFTSPLCCWQAGTAMFLAQPRKQLDVQAHAQLVITAQQARLRALPLFVLLVAIVPPAQARLRLALLDITELHKD